MYIATSNGAVSMELTVDYRSVAEQLRWDLGLLDGDKDFAYSIWYVPDDAGWPDRPGYRPNDHGDEYLQSAGASHRMSVELRRREDDGAYRMYAVGRPGDDPVEPEETISFAVADLRVRPSEVFDADEAAKIYLAYYETHTVPDHYLLRLLPI